jgi:hypothetical protein
LSNTLEDPVERMLLIQKKIQVFPKPLASNNFRMVECSILSMAFSKSSFSMAISFLEWSHRCRYSNAQAKQSWMVLCLRNPYWFLWMREVIMVYSLLAKSVVIIFMEALSNEIGL